MTEQGRSRLFVAYAAGQWVAIVGLFVLQPDSRMNVLLQVLSGWCGAAALAVRGLRGRRAGGLGWLLIGLGVFSNATGIVVAAVFRSHGMPPENAPLVNVFWFGFYPATACGLTLLMRHRGVERDWASLIDAAIITTGFGLLSWVLLIRPAVTLEGGSLVEHVIGVAYPIGDLALLGMTVRMTLGASRQTTAIRLALAALLAFLSIDVGWAVMTQLSIELSGTPRNALLAGAMGAYALFGAAALHPSAAFVAAPGARPRTALSPLLLAGLTAATLIAPVVLGVEVGHGKVIDGQAIAVCAAVLFVLVVLRMAQLVRRLEEKTRQLAERNRSARLVLDTVNEGLLRVAPDGALLLERSAIIDRWLRPFDRPIRFVDYVGEFDAAFALAFELGYEALIEGVMPQSVCLNQLPARLHAAGRDYRVTYLPVLDGERQDGLLVVLEDVTEQLRLARQDAEQRELVAMFQAVTSDPDGFVSFLEEANRLAEQIADETLDEETRKRAIHTLKGNASMASLNGIVGLCHAAEDAMSEAESIRRAAIDELRNRWSALAGGFRTLVGEHLRRTIAVLPEEVEDLRGEIERGLPRAQIVEQLASWHDEPVERPLRRLGDHARALAGRLGRCELTVDVDGGGIRLDPDRWAPLWSELVHVVRNAVDHGLESPDERRAASKPSPARLRLAAFQRRARLEIEIEDDGRGIDWEAIRRAAGAHGLPARTEGDLCAALLTSGVSGRQDSAVAVAGAVGESGTVSGRGVGLSAVATCVEQLGGELAVTSRPGAGTTWRFSFPESGAAESGGSLRSRPASRERAERTGVVSLAPRAATPTESCEPPARGGSYPG